MKAPLFFDKHGRGYNATPPAKLISALRTEPHITNWIFKKNQIGGLAIGFEFIAEGKYAKIHYNTEGEYTSISCTPNLATEIGAGNAISRGD